MGLFITWITSEISRSFLESLESYEQFDILLGIFWSRSLFIKKVERSMTFLHFGPWLHNAIHYRTTVDPAPSLDAIVMQLHTMQIHSAFIFCFSHSHLKFTTSVNLRYFVHDNHRHPAKILNLQNIELKQKSINVINLKAIKTQL